MTGTIVTNPVKLDIILQVLWPITPKGQIYNDQYMIFETQLNDNNAHHGLSFRFVISFNAERKQEQERMTGNFETQWNDINYLL